jgi:predicted dehydrogenase
MKNFIKRREFITKSVSGTIGVSMSSTLSAFSILPSWPVKDKFKIAIMGLNGRGADHIKGFLSLPNVEVAYVCDVDQRAIDSGVDLAIKYGQTVKPKGVADFRRALDDNSVDALTIAVPDHWHMPAALLGLKAGKHVYVEKPGSHNPAEGELLCEATTKYRKVVQLGNQRRSWSQVMEAMKKLHEGVIGRVYYARTWYTNTRPTIGKGKEISVPAWLNYDLWQGPAPRKSLLDNMIHYNWHWRWHWGTGELLNNGTHYIDVARWGLQVDYPKKVYSTGGRYQFKDDWQTPDTQVATFDFDDDKTILWEGRSCNQRSINNMGTGISFHGEEGTLEINGNNYTIYNNKGEVVKNPQSESSTIITQTGPGLNLDKDHMANFVSSMESGALPHSHYPECFKSVLLCHLGNISYRTGRALEIDSHTGHILHDSEAVKLWTREYEKGWEPVIS